MRPREPCAVDEVAEDPLGSSRDVRVRMGFGGICGSDLHYYNHGGFGNRAP